MKNNRLRTLRDSKRLTQQEVADIIGEPKRTYASWERGERKTPDEIMIKLADFYETTIDELIGRNSEPAAMPDDSDKAKLLRIIDGKSPEEIKALLTILEHNKK